VTVKVRPEQFGCIVFDMESRKHIFITDGEPVSTIDRPDIRSKIADKFGFVGDQMQLELVGEKIGRRLSAPLCLYLEITKYCTIRCKHCYKSDNPLQQEMTKEDIFKLLNDAKKMGVFEVRLCGNEPTISPIFKVVCEQILALGFYLSVNTSGIMGDQKIRQIVEIRPHHVIVSVDGTRETNDAIRMTGAFDRAVALLHALQKAGIPRRINCVLSGLTIDHIDDVVTLAEDVGCGISFIPLRTMGRSTAFKESSSLTREQMYKAVQQITQLKKDVPDVPLETFFDILGNGFWAHHTMDVNIPCPAGKNGFVTADGKFYPCDWLRYLGEQFCCGDVRENDLSYVWENSTTLRSFQQIERRKCLQCSHYLTTCYGGCWCSYEDSMACGDYEDQLCFVSLIDQK
jgi:pyrroloquinoline quinone biosynthesis protein E